MEGICRVYLGCGASCSYIMRISFEGACWDSMYIPLTLLGLAAEQPGLHPIQ